ncbi:MAG: class I SAM-dependent methyltransferase [Opitutaceae bacterium]|nr:class I SAM-dependent methyltransferase [Verrucomicrobiales bacterium]
MDETLYRKFFAVEKRHWWFVARRRIVLDLIQHRLRIPPGAAVLDIGCGTGAILQALSQRYNATGLDQSPLAIELCHQQRIANALLGDFEVLPDRNQRFDLITLLDVIEHLDDDLTLLKASRERLTPGGSVLVTVPAWPSLWSKHDDLNHHRRRYRRGPLRDVLQRAGFEVTWISYYNTVLFPLALAHRLFEKSRPDRPDPALEIPPSTLNSLLISLFAAERYWLRVGSFPTGLSLIAVGRKPSN